MIVNVHSDTVRKLSESSRSTEVAESLQASKTQACTGGAVALNPNTYNCLETTVRAYLIAGTVKCPSRVRRRR